MLKKTLLLFLPAIAGFLLLSISVKAQLSLPDNSLKKAAILVDSAQYDSAIYIAQTHIHSIDSPDAYVIMARILCDQGKFRNAMAYLLVIDQQAENNRKIKFWARLKLAECYYFVNDKNKVMDYLEDCVYSTGTPMDIDKEARRKTRLFGLSQHFKGWKQGESSYFIFSR